MAKKSTTKAVESFEYYTEDHSFEMAHKWLKWSIGKSIDEELMNGSNAFRPGHIRS